MTTQVKRLVAGQRAAHPNGDATEELVEVLQRIVARIEEQNAILAAISAVTAPSGGATQDAEARAAINAIIAAAT